MPRVTRSGDNRTVTCLEAAELGFAFVKTCSKCDYYLQNRALNMKALSMPRSELSKMWQCTSLHRVGDLNSSEAFKTPYQEVPITSYNSYIVTDRSSGSSPKRVRLFESVTQSAITNSSDVQENNNNSILGNGIGQTGAFGPVQRALIERDEAHRERNEAHHERDEARRARDEAFRERDLAYHEKREMRRQRDIVILERDAAVIDRNSARSKMESAIAERDAADISCAEKQSLLDKALASLSSLTDEIGRWKNSCQKLQEENKQLLDTLETRNTTIALYAQHQSQLNNRVLALEHNQAGYASNRYVMVRPNGPKIKYIQNFAAALFPETNKKERLKVLFDLLYENRKSFRAHVNRSMKPLLLPLVKQDICKEIRKFYAPWKILEVLDGSKQSLNQECYKAIYSVQKKIPKWAKILPEIKTVQKAQYKLDSHLQDIIPLHLEVGRDTGYFQYSSYLDYILNKFGLLEIIDNPTTTDPVKVGVTFDGGSVSRFLGHVTGGFKLVDSRAKHPVTKEFLFGDSGHEKLQSHVHCFPVKMAMAKDTKELYRNEFGDFFLFLKEYEREKGFKVKFLFPQDMSSIWKTTGRGGTAKVKSFPCYCCAVTTSSLVSAQPKEKCFRGQRCKQPVCYHHPMICDETIQHWEEEKQQLEQQYPYLSTPGPDLHKSQVFLSSINELRDELNPYDIQYQPSTLEEGIQFNSFINTELSYRHLPTNGTIREKRERLQSALEAEQIYGLMTKLVASIDHESAFCAVSDAIPCIMHGGNRINEKLFMMVLLEAWDSCVTNRDRERLIEAVENYINCGVFGTPESKAHWKLPVSKELELETVSFTAWRGKKVIDKLSDIAHLIMLDQDQTRLRQWQTMISKYLDVMKFAFRHEDFSDDELEDFQDLIDEWFYLYVQLVGLPGITNYIHLLGAGHLYFYIKKWGSLYRYQQQGWEMKNSVIASFIMRRTRKGGSGGKYGPAHTSRIEPLLKWFRRSTAWATGDATAYFLEDEVV